MPIEDYLPDLVDLTPVGPIRSAVNVLGQIISPSTRQPAPNLNSVARTVGESRRRTRQGAPRRTNQRLASVDDYIRQFGAASQADLARQYTNARQSIVRRVRDAGQRERALANFDADPRIQAMRQLIGYERMTTRRSELQDIARTALQRRSQLIDETARRQAHTDEDGSGGWGESINDFGAAIRAGILRNTFGLGERAVARGLYHTGNAGNLDYDETLQAVRANTDENMGRSMTGNILGAIVSGGGLGAAAGGLARRGAARLASSAAPALARGGRVIRALTNADEGFTLANAGRAALAGGLGAGAQAIGEESDNPITDTLIGAAGAPIIGGLIHGARAGARNLASFARPYSSNVSRGLREVVTENPDAVLARHTDLQSRTRAPVPLVAALRGQDYDRVVERAVRNSPDSAEIAQGHGENYLRGFMNRMLQHVNRAGTDADAMFTTRGDLLGLRRQQADEMMAPIADSEVDLNELELDDLERQMTRQIGGRIVGLNKRLDEALSDISEDDMARFGINPEDVGIARSILSDWGLAKPVTATVREMDALRRSLNAAARGSYASNPANSMAFKNASHAISEFIADRYPRYQEMVDQYAANSRMIEGFETASAGRRAEDLDDIDLIDNLNTPEGRVGLRAGELFRQREAVSNRPTAAMSTARDLASRGNLTRPFDTAPNAARPGTVTLHMGGQPAADLADAAEAETSVLNRMLDTSRLSNIDEDRVGELNFMDVARLAALGGSLVETKIRVVSNLLKSFFGNTPTPLNKKVANELTEMLFSQDPATIQRAIDTMQRAGIDPQQALRQVQNAFGRNIGRGAALAGMNNTNVSDYEQPSIEETSESPETPVDDADQVGQPEGQEGVPVALQDSPYGQNLQYVYDNESPELLDLFDRVIHQESRGSQHGADGLPLESSAGAIGVAQVMPETAPEAARLAGLPWDENAYRHDEAYNRLLGMAYLSEMLRRYNGDVTSALVAYNAGPRWGDRFNAGDPSLPQETIDYLHNILG